MNDWLTDNPQLLASAAAVLFVAAIIFLAFWLHARLLLARTKKAGAASEWTRIDHDLALAEQSGRLRSIRELQDVAILSVSRLTQAAEGARFVVETDPGAAARLANGLAEQANTALQEMRRVQAIVHEGEHVAAPQPSQQSVHELFAALRRAGLIIDFSQSGEDFPLKEGAQLAVLRILQQALDNALHHGGAGTTVRVTLTWKADGLQLAIDDDGIRASARRAGLSAEQVDRQTAYTLEDDLRSLTQDPDGAALTQMRERAALYGGVLSAKVVPGVGFSVSAVFPLLRLHDSQSSG